MAIETVGYKIVVQGAAKATSELSQLNKAVTNSQQSLLNLGKLKGPSSGLGGISSSLSNIVGNAKQSNTALSQLANNGLSNLANRAIASNSALSQLSSITGITGSSIAAMAGPVAIATGGLVALVAATGAFYALGARGAALQPTINAFGNLASQYGNSTELLNRYREQTKGTVTDVNLLRTATFALSGANKELGTILANDLGVILNDTRRLAEALGRDPVEAQTRFIDAIKKGERELLDELGIIVGADEAYQKYAESIGKSANALTDQEKKTAFATEAIRQLSVSASQLGDQSSVLTNLSRPFVALQNVLDKLSLAVLPAFAPVSQIIADISGGLEKLATSVLPLVAAGFEVVGVIITTAWNGAKAALDAVFGGIFDVAGVALPYLIAMAQLAAEGFRVVIEGISSIVSQVASTISSLFPDVASNVDTQIQGLAGNLLQGGANIIGSFAAGLLRGGTYVVQAVTAIARIVADFLEGFSPPKKGPLSKIDQGGYNVAKAWADGFRQGALEPIEQVTKAIDAQLGDIGKLNAEQVATRMALLEQAVQPFVDQLDIAKGIFEQIAGFVDPALKAIERQTKLALKTGDASTVRAFDQQAQLLKDIQQQEQSRVDEAEIQLALAKSQYAQELALLNVQKKRVGEVEKLTGAGGGAGAMDREAVEKAAKAASGSGAAAMPDSVTQQFQAGQAPNLLDMAGVAEARQFIQSNVAQGLGASGFGEALAGFQSQTGQLQIQLGRIQAANPGQKIADKLKPATDAFSKVTDTIKTVKNSVSDGLSSISQLFTTYFGEDSNIQTILLTLTGEGGLLSSTGGLGLAFTKLFGEEGIISTLISDFETRFTTFLNNITFSIASFPETVRLFFSKPFEDAKTLIYSILEELLATLSQFASGTLGLDGLGASLTTAFVNPFIDAVNGVIGKLNEGLASIIGQVASLSGILGVDLPSISIPTIPKAAKGAIGLKGMALVGEQGPELVNFGKPANIFPNSLSRNLLDMAAQPQTIMVSPSDGAGGNTYNNQRSMNSTFNVGSPNQARILERQRMAFGGL